MRKLLAVVAVLAGFHSPYQGLEVAKESKEKNDVEIEVRLSPVQGRYQVGDPINIKVEICNKGRTGVFVGNSIPEIADWIYNLRLTVVDSQGRVSPSMTASPPFVSPKYSSEAFSSALIRRWLVLYPGYYLGRTITIDSTTFQFLRHAGQYKISGVYSSQGMDAPLYYNPLSKETDSIQKLAYPQWKGTLTTNEISVEIINRRVAHTSPPKLRSHHNHN